MPPRSKNELINLLIRKAEADIERIDALIDDASPRGLDADHLGAMYQALADYTAQLRLILAIEDPRNADAWRDSAEGKALERLRQQEQTRR